MHVTRIPLELEKRNKDFQTLHKQANIVLIDLNLPSSSTGPIKTCVVFLVACVILQNIFKF